MKKQKSLEDDLYKIGIWVLAVCCVAVPVYFGALLNHVNLPSCVWFTYLGIYCPGCGGTRAVDALLHGRVLESVWYHPLILYTVVIFGGFMLTQTLQRLGIRHVKGWKFHNWYLYGAILVTGCNFLIKNLLLRFWGIAL